MSSAAAIPNATRAKLPTLHTFFSADGILSKSSLNFEVRKGQYEMATAVESALNDKRHLIVEAGTGPARPSPTCCRHCGLRASGSSG